MRTDLTGQGLVYFWFLNSDCGMEAARSQLAAFARGGVSAVVLHPRNGLLVPYGGTDWFDLVRAVVGECVRLGLEPWLYDEDPYPSGNAGGTILMDHPEYRALGIERFEADDRLTERELFVFPAGKLIWAGAVPPRSDDEPVELTGKVGVIRRHWEVSPWDSRWYYPATPLYDCPRSNSYVPELALRKTAVPDGWHLVAFVARPAGLDRTWGGLVDSLNPAATRDFLARTHERYAESLGDMLGKEIPAIFTDEPKCSSAFPWTPGLFESFCETYGYDLRRRLEHLFSRSDDPEAMRSRLDYREWCGRRFTEAWLRPVADWCREHGLALVGHISPEDDPIEQTRTLGNLLPMYEHMDLAGLDLIIPAVGDSQHPLINVGAAAAAGAAQQMEKPGVLSETLACSGLEPETSESARILAWQVVSGVSTIVVHGAFFSTTGLRVFDGPPDFGPDSPRWEGMCDIDRGLRPFLELSAGSTQVAPVAILWPIRSFNADPADAGPEAETRRAEMNDLLLACLEKQAGTHLLDEDALARARLEEGCLRLGRARYEMLLVPPVSVLHGDTVRRLSSHREAGFPVYLTGKGPRFIQTADGLAPAGEAPWEPVGTDDVRAWCLEHLPRLLPLEGDDLRDLRAGTWVRNGETTTMLMNLARSGRRVGLGGEDLDIGPGELLSLREEEGRWRVLTRFDPLSVTPARPVPPTLGCRNWHVRWPGGAWQPIDRPVGVHQLGPPWREPGALVPMTLTGTSAVGGAPVAEYLDYRAEVVIDDVPVSSVLVLEPTTLRGRFTLTVAGRELSFCLRDTDTAPVELDLTDLLEEGSQELVFRLHDPLLFDGIKWAPTIRVQHAE